MAAPTHASVLAEKAPPGRDEAPERAGAPLFPLIKTCVLQATRAVSPLTPAASPVRRRPAMRHARRPLYAVAIAATVVSMWWRWSPRAGSGSTASGVIEGPPPAVRGPPPRAHRAQRGGNRPQRARPQAVRGRHDRGRHAALRPLALLRRGRAVAAPGLPAPPSPGGHRVPGSVGVLTTRGSENYYHFLTDVLPRLHLLRRAGVAPDAFLVDRWTRFQRDLLDHLGLTDDRCSGREVSALRADELVVPSVPDDQLRTPPWIVPWCAAFLPDDGAAPPAPLRDPRAPSTRGASTTRRSSLPRWSRWASRPSTRACCPRPSRCAPSPRRSTSCAARRRPDQPRLRHPRGGGGGAVRGDYVNQCSGRWPRRWRGCATATWWATAPRPGPGGTGGGLRHHGRSAKSCPPR